MNDQNDLISRSALIDAINQADWKDDTHAVLAKSVCIGFAEDAPAVTPPERTGRWEMDGKDHCHCTNCKHGRDIKTQIGWHYCPNCGAHMTGGGGDGNG